VFFESQQGEVNFSVGEYPVRRCTRATGGGLAHGTHGRHGKEEGNEESLFYGPSIPCVPWSIEDVGWESVDGACACGGVVDLRCAGNAMQVLWDRMSKKLPGGGGGSVT